MTQFHVLQTSYDKCWSEPSELWVILNPEQNFWIEQIDPSLNLLLRRVYVREEARTGTKLIQPLLIAAPAGHPAPRVLLLENQDEQGWFKKVESIAGGLRVKSVTVFPPRAWRAPKVSRTESTESKVGLEIRWVE